MQSPLDLQKFGQEIVAQMGSKFRGQVTVPLKPGTGSVWPGDLQRTLTFPIYKVSEVSSSEQTVG
jgi:hypothetical protein